MLYANFRVDTHALDLLDRMLEFNPTHRITAEQALSHEYFKSLPLPCLPEQLPKIAGEQHESQIKTNKQIQKKAVEDSRKNNVPISKQINEKKYQEEELSIKRQLPQQASHATTQMEPEKHISKHE